MEKYARLFLKHLTKIMEFVIAALLACGIIIMIVQLIFSIGALPDLNTYPNYDDLLTACFNLIIGVELIRMLYLHTPITVFEILLFAIARQVIMEQPDRRRCHCHTVCHEEIFVRSIRRDRENNLPRLTESISDQPAVPSGNPLQRQRRHSAGCPSPENGGRRYRTRHRSVCVFYRSRTADRQNP